MLGDEVGWCKGTFIVVARNVASQLYPKLSLSSFRLYDLNIGCIIRSQIHAGLIHISQCGRKPYPSDWASDGQFQTSEQGPQLDTSLAVEHGVNFVENYCANGAKYARDLESAPNEQSFQRFRRY